MSRMVNYVQSYLGEFLVLVVLALFVLGVGYVLAKKFIWKGKKVCSFANVIFAAIFLAYLFVVLALTLLSRPGGIYTGRQIVPLFYSYKSAWYSSPDEWRNIIANILLFVPFGCLLPMSMRWFQSFIKTYLAGFLFTVGIEFFQYIRDCGVCEMDDILNNFLGTMIGYGIFVAGSSLYKWIKRKVHGLEGRAEERKKCTWISVVFLQVPLIVTVLAAGVLYTVYQNKELGILECAWDSGYSMEDGQVQSQVTFETEKEILPVYKTKIYNEEEAKAIAETIFSYLGTSMDEIEIQKFDQSICYRDGQGNDIWITYVGGGVSYSSFSNDGKGNCDMEEEDLRDKLQEFGIYIPKDAEFENLGEDLENGQYTFTADMCKEGNLIYDGELTLTCRGKEGSISSVNNNIVACEVYKEYSTRSQQQAYERIVKGKFAYPIYFWKETGNIEVDKPYIDYQIDSKGFYQPVYVFPVDVESMAYISIPAIPQ